MASPSSRVNTISTLPTNLLPSLDAKDGDVPRDSPTSLEEEKGLNDDKEGKETQLGKDEYQHVYPVMRTSQTIMLIFTVTMSMLLNSKFFFLIVRTMVSGLAGLDRELIFFWLGYFL